MESDYWREFLVRDEFPLSENFNSSTSAKSNLTVINAKLDTEESIVESCGKGYRENGSWH